MSDMYKAKLELSKFNQVIVFRPSYAADQETATFNITFDSEEEETEWELIYEFEAEEEFVKFTLVPKSQSISFDLEIHLALVNSSGAALTRWDLWRLKGSKLISDRAVNDGFFMKVSTIDENIDDFCSGDCLTLKLMIFNKMSEPVPQKKERLTQDRSVTKTILSELKRSFESGENSDVTVESSDGIEMHLHKFQLMTRSTTFKQMFKIEMKEKETSCVKIKDFDHEVLRELFRFIYYGDVEGLDAIDIELFKAAKRYDIKELSELCIQSIVENINKRNVVELLELAEVFKEPELFEYVAQIFFCQHNQIVISEDWKKLKNEIKLKAYDSITKLSLENCTKIV